MEFRDFAKMVMGLSLLLIGISVVMLVVPMPYGLMVFFIIPGFVLLFVIIFLLAIRGKEVVDTGEPFIMQYSYLFFGLIALFAFSLALSYLD